MHKNTKHLTLLTLFSIFAILLTACQSANPTHATDLEPTQVTVSIVPLAYFVDRIGGDLVSTNIMVLPGESPHSYEPTADQMKALANSAVFFSIGVEYEDNWLPRFEEINPDLKIVDSSAGIERIEMTAEDDHGVSETAEDHSSETGLDPHVWLSPANGKIIAANVLAALSELDPVHAETYQANTESLLADIDQVDASIRETLSGMEQKTFMVFHPSWGYFAHDYGLEQIPVQVEGQDPSASELAGFVETAREHNIKVIFVQPSFSTEDAQAIAQEIGGEIAIIDPLAEDWLSNLQSVAEAFAATQTP
jgi:zinc transport system substrate-binding protein